jgi:hypothetical protein
MGINLGFDLVPYILKYICIIDPNNNEWEMNMTYRTPEDLNSWMPLLGLAAWAAGCKASCTGYVISVRYPSYRFIYRENGLQRVLHPQTLSRAVRHLQLDAVHPLSAWRRAHDCCARRKEGKESAVQHCACGSYSFNLQQNVITHKPKHQIKFWLYH